MTAAAYVRRPDVIERLRADVARGAAHECEEWEGEQDGKATGTCLLCDRPISSRGRATLLRDEQLDRDFPGRRRG